MHLMFEFYSLRQTYYYKYVINIHLHYELQSLPNVIVEKIVKFIKLSQETNHKICYVVLVKWISKFIKCFWDKIHQMVLKKFVLVKWVWEVKLHNSSNGSQRRKESQDLLNNHEILQMNTKTAKLEEQSCKKPANFVEKS